MLIVGRRHLAQILRVYIDHYNRRRPHRSLALEPPDGIIRLAPEPALTTQPLRVKRHDRLGGLIHEYALAAA